MSDASDSTDSTDSSVSELSAPTRLTFVRHGESNVTVQRMIGGMMTCTGLSELGLEQANRLRDRYDAGHEPAVDALWSSDMPRALETAQAVNQALDLPLNVSPEFQEFRPGEADGMLFDEYIEQHGPVDQMAHPYRELAPGGESRASFFLRVGVALEQLIADNVGQSVMVVCHGGVVDVAVRTLLRIQPENRFYLSTINTSLTELSTTETEPLRHWQLVRYNDSAHLAGLPADTPPA